MPCCASAAFSLLLSRSHWHAAHELHLVICLITGHGHGHAATLTEEVVVSRTDAYAICFPYYYGQ